MRIIINPISKNNIFSQSSYNYKDIKAKKNDIVQYFDDLEITEKQTQVLLEIVECVQKDLNNASLSEEKVTGFETKLKKMKFNAPRELIYKLMEAATHDSSKIFYNKDTKTPWFSYFGYINYTESLSKIIKCLNDKSNKLAKELKPYLNLDTRYMTTKEIINASKYFPNFKDPSLLFDIVDKRNNLSDEENIKIVSLFIKAGADAAYADATAAAFYEAIERFKYAYTIYVPSEAPGVFCALFDKVEFSFKNAIAAFATYHDALLVSDDQAALKHHSNLNHTILDFCALADKIPAAKSSFNAALINAFEALCFAAGIGIQLQLVYSQDDLYDNVMAYNTARAAAHLAAESASVAYANYVSIHSAFFNAFNKITRLFEITTRNDIFLCRNIALRFVGNFTASPFREADAIVASYYATLANANHIGG